MQSLESLGKQFGKHYPQYLLTVLMLATLSMVLASTSINVALPSIMNEFHVGRPIVQWLSTGFLASMTSGLLLASWSLARFGAKTTYSLGLFVFTLSSVLSPFVHTIWQLILLRITQGLCAGIIQPLATVLIFRAFSAGGRGKAIGIYGLGVILAPSIGPAIAGYLIDYFGWTAVFWLPVPFCLIGLIAGKYLLPSDHEKETPMLDFLAFILSFLALLTLLGALSELQRFSVTNKRVWLPALIGLLSGLFFFVRTKNSHRPLLALNLWKNKIFLNISLVTLMLGIGVYGSTYLIPLYLQLIEHYTAGRAGLLLAPAGVCMGVSSFVSGWLTDKINTIFLVYFGLIVLIISLFGFAGSSLGASFVFLCFWACVGRCGLGILMPAITTHALDSLTSDQLSAGASAITFVRQLGGALGVSLLTFLLEWRHRAGGGDFMAETVAFHQVFYVLAVLFVITIWFAYNSSVSKK